MLWLGRQTPDSILRLAYPCLADWVSNSSGRTCGSPAWPASPRLPLPPRAGIWYGCAAAPLWRLPLPKSTGSGSSMSCGCCAWGA